ncbi:hypothetical protein D3D02_17720 [Halobellus sp. Atlit-38R]|nr:hypothetical protein D3D02_17720 [Halobellus sp. Atlit-38R]
MRPFVLLPMLLSHRQRDQRHIAKDLTEYRKSTYFDQRADRHHEFVLNRVLVLVIHIFFTS